jgi:PAS domain-containing protein
MYGCESWSLTLREESRRRVFENRALRRIFGPKRDEIVGGGKPHTEELHNLHSSTNIIRMTKLKRMRWAGNVERIKIKMNANSVVVGNPEGKRPLGGYRRR